MRRAAPLLLLLPLLGGCGLKPLYGGGSSGAVAQTLAGIEVAPIDGRSGWLVRNALLDRLAASGAGTPRYRLVIKLDDQIEGFGVRRNEAITRERRTLRARFQLVDVESGKTVVDDSAASDTGIDVAGSEYATIAAEQTALERLAVLLADQIVGRVALTAAAPGRGK
jgi:LPS-assembly lipoprotein